MSKLNKGISIILPVYNEKDLILPALEQIDAFMDAHFERYEIMVIESGSTDGTAALCDRAAEKFSRVRVIHEGGRNGFGSALKLGYQNAALEYCWLVTADIPFDLEHILTAVPLLDRNDFIISYRSEDNRGLSRRFQSAVYNALVKALLKLDVRSINSAFKVLPTAVMAQMEIISSYWFIDAEILYRLTRAGYRYTEIPVPLIDRSVGTSSVSKSAFIRMLSELHAFMRIKRSIPDGREKPSHIDRVA